MSNCGWIKLYRELLGNQIFKNENLLKVWIWCLLKASHSPRDELVGLQKIHLEPGQFWTGRFNAASELDMKPSTAWKLLKKLESPELDQKLNIKSNNKFSVVTVTNWALYQQEGGKRNTDRDSKVTTKRQQNNTNKNDKNDKNDLLNNYGEFVKMEPQEYTKLVAQYGEETTQKFIEKLNNYKGASGKTYKSDYRAILTWVVDEVMGKGGRKDAAPRRSSPTVQAKTGGKYDQHIPTYRPDKV